jgi:hypothetical protein
MEDCGGGDTSSLFFVDVECLREINGRLLIKELCIAQQNGSCQTWLFTAPYSFYSLPRNVRKENQWITTHLNGIEWTDGNIPLCKLRDIFNQYIPHNSIVYVKGWEKSQLIQWKLPGRFVFNLEDIGCPPVSRIELATTTKCMHPHRCSTGVKRNHCAQFKCVCFMHWFHEETTKSMAENETLRNMTSSPDETLRNVTSSTERQQDIASPIAPTVIEMLPVSHSTCQR